MPEKKLASVEQKRAPETKGNKSVVPDYAALFKESLMADAQVHPDLKQVMDLQNHYVAMAQRDFVPLHDKMAAWAASATTPEERGRRWEAINESEKSAQLLAYSKLWTDPQLSGIKGIDSLQLRKDFAKAAMDAGVVPPEELWTGKPVPNSFFEDCRKHVESLLKEKSEVLDQDSVFLNQNTCDLMAKSGLTRILQGSIMDLSSEKTQMLYQKALLSHNKK